MNIFIMDWDVNRCAQWHGDKHLGKMILEGTQLLCNAHHWLGSPAPYRPTHMNHPCSVWARMYLDHWVYLRQLVLAMGREWTHRFGTTHKSATTAASLRYPNLPRGWINPPLVVPEKYQWGSVPISYRLYYLHEKKAMHKWTRRKAPWWIPADPDIEYTEPTLFHVGEDDIPDDVIHVGPGTEFDWLLMQKRLPCGKMTRRISKRRMQNARARHREALRGRHLLCHCRTPHGPRCFGLYALLGANAVTAEGWVGPW